MRVLTVTNKALPPEFVYSRYKFRINMLKSEEECVKKFTYFFCGACCCVVVVVERVSLLGVRRRS